MPSLSSLLRSLADTVGREASRAVRSGRARPARRPSSPAASGYPGDFTGRPLLDYAPREDRTADPGEVVWTWVPYEEDHSRGKDRPVLVIGRDGEWLLALPMTSQDHDRDARQEAAEGRFWADIGTGAWDRDGRPSEVRVNRIIRVPPEGIRRIAARLPRERYDEVARAVLRHYR
ncbi:MAG: type II toxin-antitoxin system PemK/MazF family toxin [Propionicimonas sp.]|nr:type II toxin-antitoxin system PemK/MazF family toxin [Propionicimonas sp.]